MKQKKCSKCKNVKPIEDFNSYNCSRRKKKVIYPSCKDCKRKQSRKAVKKYNINNRDRVLNYEQANREKKREIIHKQYRKKCVKCNEDRIYLIDFHHIDPSTKLFNPLNNYQRSLKSIIEEIKKCVCLCANCHREFHHFQRENGITIKQYLNEK